MEEQSIKITKDGPYLVSGSVPFRRGIIKVDAEGESIEWEKGPILEDQEVKSLCRCGNSGCKPYCDGSHTLGFDGTETASKEPYLKVAETIEGPLYDLLDQKDLCAEARFCHPKGGSWNLVKESKEEVLKVFLNQCKNCPSGRYTAVEKKTGKAIEPEMQKEIVITNDPSANCGGPLWVTGGIKVESENGENYDIRNRVTLCRCGQSKNKPFCDGSHIESGFELDH